MNGFKLIFKFIFICLLLNVSSCYFEMPRDNSNDPDADNFTPPALSASFIPSSKSGNVPMTVHFENNSIGSIESCEWDFNNDGITDSTEQNPSYIFTSAGKYNVKLKVTSIGHYTDEKTEQITVSFGTPERRTISEGNEGPYTLYPADIDNDGDIDFICGYSRDNEYNNNYLNNKLSWWENTDSGSQWIEHIIAVADETHPLFTISIHAADVNHDGFMDIVASLYSKDEIVWWENDGTPRDDAGGDGKSWTKHEVASNFIRACSVYACDIDGDGDIDIAGASNGTWNSGPGIYENSEIRWWENDGGTGTSWIEHSIKTSLCRMADVRIADIDNDGHKDIVASVYGYIENSTATHEHSEILWFRNNDGSGGTWSENTIMPDTGPDYLRGPRDIRIADMDGDGDMDIVSAFWEDDKIVIWLNDGGGIGWTRHTIDEDFFGAQSVFIADIDGDGDPDIAGASRLGDKIAWWENIGGMWNSWEEHAIDAEFTFASSVFAADINDDSYIDLAGAANGYYLTNAGSSLAWWSVFDID
ncbi:MAG: FG-GAP-like repeat-containing protein [Spirochaetota bacterium]